MEDFEIEAKSIHGPLGQLKQLVDVTQADDGGIQSEFIDGQPAEGAHLMMGISKEKSLSTHYQ